MALPHVVTDKPTQRNFDALEKDKLTKVGLPRNVTGSRASGAALVSLLAALQAAGIITDSTTA